MAGGNHHVHVTAPAGKLGDHEPQATSMEWDKVDWSKWSQEEQHNLRHRMLEEKHRGHDMMHTEMILILFGSILIAQFLLYAWRQKHRKSYQLVTLLGLWLIPMATSCKLAFWRMVTVWCVFSAVTMFMMYKATRKKLRVQTPRRVYRWFLFIYQATYVLGILGYLLLLLVFTGLGLFFHPDVLMEAGVTLVFYGVYYGVMGRDCAEMCVDFMAASMTYTAAGKSLPKVELTPDMCAVCGQRIVAPSEEGGGAVYERTYRLNCNHLFHEFCIRGWCIVGKKQTCPYCQERVDLKRLVQNPWEKPHMLFGQLLDFVRYFVVWLPVILVIVQLTYHLLKLE